MASVILQDQRTLYLESVLETLLGASPDSLYLGIGRVGAWPNETAPPAPLNTKADRDDFFNNIIAAQLITPANIAPAVRKVEWTAGTEYVAFDDNSDASFTTNFYVMNQEKRVYKVVTAPVSQAVVTEPNGTGSGSTINTGDGYVWEYLYTITPSMEALITPNWMPVAYGSTISAEQTADGDVNAYLTLGTNHFIVNSEVSDPIISDSITYRQIALISKLRDNLDVLLTGSAALAGGISNSGLVLNLENRTPISRATGQTESFQTIFKIF